MTKDNGKGEAELLNMDRVKIDPAWALRVPSTLALRRLVLPFAVLNGEVYVACADTEDTAALEAVERHLAGQRIVAKLAERESLQRALARVYSDAPRSSTRIAARPGAAADGEGDDAVSVSQDLLHAAIIRGASDIHIEPGRENVRVRFRVDGVLEEFQRLPLAREAGLISRLKVMSGMDIAEKRAPQDGGFAHRIGAGVNARNVDIRAATLPTKYGEKMTLRLLGLQTGALTLEKLGMCPADLERMEHVLSQPHGLLLLTGPTGSGKTTTLYAAIQRLIKSAELNIITIEDPIEYEIAGVSQVEVDSGEKVSFSRALRSVLRHDPDVVMIGEIRDADTLDIAIKSSLTGHLVLSTLHTNTAAGAVTRLADMGLARFMIAATLRLCVAQRLVRKLCPDCRAPRPLTEAEAALLGGAKYTGQTVFEPTGCVYCAGRGYSGRLGLFEMMTVNDEVCSHVGTGMPEHELTAAMKAKGMATLIDDAREKIFMGLTTVREALNAVATW